MQQILQRSTSKWYYLLSVSFSTLEIAGGGNVLLLVMMMLIHIIFVGFNQNTGDAILIPRSNTALITALTKKYILSEFSAVPEQPGTF